MNKKEKKLGISSWKCGECDFEISFGKKVHEAIKILSIGVFNIKDIIKIEISRLIREENRQGDKDRDRDKPFKAIGDRYPISTFTGETKRELVEFIKHIESQARFDGYLKGREEGINMFNKINKTQIALA